MFVKRELITWITSISNKYLVVVSLKSLDLSSPSDLVVTLIQNRLLRGDETLTCLHVWSRRVSGIYVLLLCAFEYWRNYLSLSSNVT